MQSLEIYDVIPVNDVGRIDALFVLLRRGGGHKIIDGVAVFVINMNNLSLQQFACEQLILTTFPSFCLSRSINSFFTPI